MPSIDAGVSVRTVLIPPVLTIATEGDVDFLARVALEANAERSATDPGWDRDAFQRGLVDDAAEQVAGKVPESTTYVIWSARDRSDGGVEDEPVTDSRGRVRVGRLRLIRTAVLIEIAGLQVLPDCQNQGVGTAVIGRVVAEAARRRVPVELEVEDDNPDALRLYLRLGFVDLPADRGADRGRADRVRMSYRNDAGDVASRGTEWA